MYTQALLVISLIIMIFFIYKIMKLKPSPDPPPPPPPDKPLTPLEFINERKESLLSFFKQNNLKLKVNFPPITCIDDHVDHYEMEELEMMKEDDPDLLKELVDCGLVHNLYLLTMLEEWVLKSKTHSEASFDNFQYLCIRPPSDISTINFANIKNLIAACIQTNQNNITYPYNDYGGSTPYYGYYDYGHPFPYGRPYGPFSPYDL